MQNPTIIKGDGGHCAYCNQTPNNRYVISSRAFNILIWACTQEHAQFAWKETN